ncbi:hypothetical protein [Pararhizobium sp. DWP3-4]|uniref:hypothetical protein n=1 Tax=unclassified Pararhizobium TaxID=2643050 RepID=UPI003CF771E3
MTVSTTNIWKSAAASARLPSKSRDRHQHIGTTLRDLYFAEAPPKTDRLLSDLLTDLDAAEKASRKGSGQ